MATGEIALGLTISQSFGTQRVVGPQGSLRLLEVQQDTPPQRACGPCRTRPWLLRPVHTALSSQCWPQDVILPLPKLLSNLTTTPVPWHMLFLTPETQFLPLPQMPGPKHTPGRKALYWGGQPLTSTLHSPPLPQPRTEFLEPYSHFWAHSLQRAHFLLL